MKYYKTHSSLGTIYFRVCNKGTYDYYFKSRPGSITTKNMNKWIPTKHKWIPKRNPEFKKYVELTEAEIFIELL